MAKKKGKRWKKEEGRGKIGKYTFFNSIFCVARDKYEITSFGFKEKEGME